MTIEDGCSLQQTLLGNNTHIKKDCNFVKCVLGDGVVIGNDVTLPTGSFIMSEEVGRKVKSDAVVVGRYIL